MTTSAIILFDGHCLLCSRTVDFLLRRDRRRRLRFAALQSPAGRDLLARYGLADAGLDSVVLVAGGHVATRSAAVLGIARALGGGWAGLAALGALVPRRLGDALYDAVARRRIRWFGYRDTCRLPGPAEIDRFL